MIDYSSHERLKDVVRRGRRAQRRPLRCPHDLDRAAEVRILLRQVAFDIDLVVHSYILHLSRQAHSTLPQVQGKNILTVVPSFSALSAATMPALRSTKRLTSARPSPVPFPGSLVVK